MSKQLNHRTLMHYILDSLGIPKEATHQFNYRDRLDTLMNNNKIKSFVYRRKNDPSHKPTILIGKKIGGQLQIESYSEVTLPEEVNIFPFLQNTDGYLAVQYENNHTQIHKVGATSVEEKEDVPNDNELISNAEYQLGYRSFTDAGYYQYPLPDSVQNRQNDVLLSLVNQIAQQLQNPFYQTVKLRVSIIKTNSSTIIKPDQEIKTSDFHSKKPDVEEYNLTNSNSLDDWEVGIKIYVDAGNQLQSIDYFTAPNYLNEQVGKWKEEAKNRGLEIDIEALRNETLRGFTSPRTKQSFYQRFVQGVKSNLSKAVGGYIEAVQATQKVTKHIWEEGRINESLWYTSSEEYSQWPSYVHPQPILGGVIDGVIDEMFGIPMACMAVYEIASDKQKSKEFRGLFTKSGAKELIKGLKNELQATLEDEEKAEHLAGQTTINVASLLTGFSIFTKGGKLGKLFDDATKPLRKIISPKISLLLDEFERFFKYTPEKSKVFNDYVSKLDDVVLNNVFEEVVEDGVSYGTKKTAKEGVESLKDQIKKDPSKFVLGKKLESNVSNRIIKETLDGTGDLLKNIAQNTGTSLDELLQMKYISQLQIHLPDGGFTVIDDVFVKTIKDINGIVLRTELIISETKLSKFSPFTIRQGEFIDALESGVTEFVTRSAKKEITDYVSQNSKVTIKKYIKTIGNGSEILENLNFEIIF